MLRHIILMLAALMLIDSPAHAVTQDPRNTTVAILMFDGVQVIDFAAPYEVFSQAGFTVHTVSRDGKPVTAWKNLKTHVDHSFGSAPAADIIVVPGGHIDEVMNDEMTLAWVRRRTDAAEHVLSVCTGSFILAKTGLLDGKSATTFHRSLEGMARDFPAIKVVRDRRWVDNGKLVTSAGLASGIDAALHLVAEVRGPRAARSVAMTLEYNWSPDWSPQQGFVRGRMADRHTRLPASLRLPEGTRLSPVLGVGDETSWESEYAVQSSLSPEAFLAHVRSQAEQDGALEVLKSPDARQLAWEYDSQLGGRWRLSYEAKKGVTPNDFVIVEKLVAVQ